MAGSSASPVDSRPRYINKEVVRKRGEISLLKILSIGGGGEGSAYD